MKKSVWSILAVIIIVLVLIFLFYINSKPKDEKIKIGIMTLTSGNLAFLGENIVRSAELAKDELGYSDKIQFIVEDTGKLGTGSETIAAYRKLVDVDKVQVIIDGMSSDGTMAVAPLLDKDQVVMITPLTGGENVDNAAEYLFRNGPSDIIAGTKPADDIFGTFGFEKIALITDNAEYTLDISKHFRNTFKGEIVLDEIITPDMEDYRSTISKIQSKDIDAIIINTATGLSAGYIIKELYEAKNNKSIFANFIAFNENTLAIASKEGFEGVYIYDVEFDEDANMTKDFFNKYTKKYGQNPTIPFHSTGTYDAVRMIMEAIDKNGYDGEKIHNYLLGNIKNWQGMNGVVTFDEKGNTHSGFVLKQVKDGKLVKVE
jgi:branched-chain amino acid transport system substrate-binding protein